MVHTYSCEPEESCAVNRCWQFKRVVLWADTCDGKASSVQIISLGVWIWELELADVGLYECGESRCYSCELKWMTTLDRGSWAVSESREAGTLSCVGQSRAGWFWGETLVFQHCKNMASTHPTSPGRKRCSLWLHVLPEINCGFFFHTQKKI